MIIIETLFTKLRIFGPEWQLLAYSPLLFNILYLSAWTTGFLFIYYYISLKGVELLTGLV